MRADRKAQAGADIASRDSPIRTLPEELPAVALLAHDGRGRTEGYMGPPSGPFPRPDCLVEGRTR